MDETLHLTRIAVAVGLSAILGFERELRGQVAGFRTHILVALGSCLFTLCGIYGFGAVYGPQAAVRADVTRIASQVVVGIGFLGGGAILRHGSSVRGLTTAANLWLAAALGVAAGVGMFGAAVVTTAFGLLVLAGFKPLERYICKHRRRSAHAAAAQAEADAQDDAELLPHRRAEAPGTPEPDGAPAGLGRRDERTEKPPAAH